MKQNITSEQFVSLSFEKCIRLLSFLGVEIEDTQEQKDFYKWNKEIVKDRYSYHFENLTIGKSIEFIRYHHQMDIYTVNDYWCVQLFDFSVCANDEKSCICEYSGKELIEVFYECIIWILDRQINT